MHMARILIVDDEQMIREVVREYALINGYEVAEASDGLEALELVEKEDFDCVILDIMMPKLDGFSACKQIKKIKPIPIIMLSARQEEYDKLFGFELGVDDYVVKPFSPKELMMPASRSFWNASKPRIPKFCALKGCRSISRAALSQ